MATVTGLTADATQTLVNGVKERSTHTGTQPASTISDLTEVIQDTVASELVAGTNVTMTYDDTAGKITISSTASGGGGGGSTEGIFLSAYTNGNGTAAANTTAIQNAINAARTAGKPLINDLGRKDVNINARLDMVGDFFEFHGHGIRFVQTANSAGGVRVGGEGQHLDGFVVYFSGNPTSSDTAANGLEFGNCLLSTYSRIVIQNSARGLFMIQEIPANGDQASNTVFSCNFENIRVSGFAISGIDMRTYIAGMAASTGNSWDNVYVHNNWFGSNGTPSSWPVIFRGFDESVFNQFNVEWCNPIGDAIFLQETKNTIFNSVHFEGITLTGTAALMRPYYDARVVVHSLFAKDIRIANDAGQKSVFRAYTADGNPGSIDATNVRVRSTQNPGNRNWGLMEVEAGCTGGDFVFRKVDVNEFFGPVVVDNTTQVPSQIEGYNDVRLRNFVAPNVAVDKLRTTDATAVTNSVTLVNDSVLQFAVSATQLGFYLLEGVLHYTVPASADFKHRFAYSGTAAGKFSEAVLGSTQTATIGSGYYQTISVNTDVIAGGIDSTEVALSFKGYINVTTAGTFNIQVAQGTANATGLVVKAGSYLTYRKLS